MADRIVRKFFDFLIESAGPLDISVDEIRELARAGLISWFEAEKAALEKSIGFELVDTTLEEEETILFKRLRAYKIIDPKVKGSDSIKLYVYFDPKLGNEPTGFCFESGYGFVIPLYFHGKEELDDLWEANEKNNFYFSSISKLDRQAYLSVVENQKKINRDG